MKTLFSAILYLFLVLYVTLTMLKGALEISSPGEQGKGVFSVLFKGIHFSARQTTAQRFCCGRGRRRRRVAHLYRGCCLSESKGPAFGALKSSGNFQIQYREETRLSAGLHSKNCQDISTNRNI